MKAIPLTQDTLLKILKKRFEENMERHPHIKWPEVEAKIKAKKNLHSLKEMESTGGEPDVVGKDEETGEILFYDCSCETPLGRRSLCYDSAALKSRKEHKPRGSAVEMATQMGIEILTETEYRTLQKLGSFDLKTSSWIKTPPTIRKRGGAIFCDRRYDTVFLYHNGAESYYAVRGFRGVLKV